MTEARYRQLKKREEWLGLLLDFCEGQEVSQPDLERALKSARRFQSDMVSKTFRYENAGGDF